MGLGRTKPFAMSASQLEKERVMRYALRDASFCAIAIASVGFMAAPSSADPDKGRPHSDRHMERTDRGTDKGAKFEHSTRHVDRDRHFDRGSAQV